MEKISAKEIYFHGTCSKLSPKILKEGFVPDPKEKIWGEGRLESYKGTYLTTNFMTAYVAAGNAFRKLGGNRVIFEVQIETRTGLMDEDELPSIKYDLQRAKGHLFTVKVVKELLSDEYKADTEKEYIKPAAKSWVSNFINKRKEGLKEVSKQFESNLEKAVEEYAWATLKDIAEYGEVSETGKKEVPEMRKAKKDIMKILKGEMSKRDVSEIMSSNIRIEEPITFKGANQILSAIEIIEKDGEKTVIKPLYKLPSPSLLKYFEGAITSNYVVKKSSLNKEIIVKKVVSKMKGVING